MNERGLIYSQGMASDTKATLISIVPFPIDEFKPGLIPGQFHVDASKDEEPQCSVIGDSLFYVYIDADRGSLKVPAPSATIARSICYDYLTAQLEAREDCFPGLFYKSGVWDALRVKKEAKDELEYHKQAQHNWFVALVKRADDDWEKTRSHHSISDTQRYALRAIDPQNTKGRPWILPALVDEATVQTCASCGSEIPSTAVVCRYCQFVVDQSKYAEMAFAKQNPPNIAQRLGK